MIIPIVSSFLVVIKKGRRSSPFHVHNTILSQ
nr:MAG TPA: hypothetical protein [Caudoviricetes sp.]